MSPFSAMCSCSVCPVRGGVPDMMQFRILHISIQLWKCLLHPTTSFTFLPPGEILPDVMIRWSPDQWLSGLFVLLSRQTDDFLQYKISPWVWNISAWPRIQTGFPFQLVLPQSSRPFLFLWCYNPSLYWQHLTALCHQYISPLHSYFSWLPRYGMEILIIILHAISVQILSWSPGKLDLSEFPREKSIDFLLIRENLFFYQWNV